MPTIDFSGNVFGANKRIEAPLGGDMLDLCDEHFAPVPFSCRSASCGTCHIDVIEGAELLEPADAEERQLLQILRGPGTARLACRARVRSGPGLIRLRSLAV
jgi:ferredoxin